MERPESSFKISVGYLGYSLSHPKVNFIRVENNDDKIDMMKKCDNYLSHPLFGNIPNKDTVEKIVNKAVFIGAKTELSEIVGYCAFYANDIQNQTAYISEICVVGEWQRRGIGSSLMQKTIELCMEKNMKFIRLEVKKDNFKAIDFYTYWHFMKEKDKDDKSFYMVKSLEST